MRIARSVLPMMVVAAAATTHCLPGDERPEPAALLVTASPSEALAAGFVTDDGWTITFDRALTVLGDVRLRDLDTDGDGRPDEEGSCNDYSETYYEWLFDLRQVSEPEKVGLAYGLGRCTIEVRLRDPSDETQIGAGATANDLSVMSERATDGYATDQAVSLYLEGVARTEQGMPSAPEGQSKRFVWVFRRAYEISACEGPSGGYVTNLGLVGETSVELAFEARVEELFRAAVRENAPTHFWPLALSDADQDGTVTLEELALVEAPEGALDGVDFSDEDAPQTGADGEPITLGDLVYDHLLPRVVRARAGGACRAELRD